LTPATYTGDLCVASNDPDNPFVVVPVTMTVEQYYDVTFVYHDLEDVVHNAEDVYVAGSFNGWNANAMALTPNVDYSVFTGTARVLSGTHEYKYIVKSGGDQWDWLNTGNHSVNADANKTVDDYRAVTVGYAHLMGPAAINIVLGQNTGVITGEVYIQSVTNPAGVGRGVMAELGYGMGSDPSAWMWSDLSYVGQNGNNDVLTSMFTPTATGTYSYAVRFDGNWGVGNPNVGWTYGDLDGVHPGDPFELENTGVLEVASACVEVTGVTLSQVTTGMIYTDTLVAFSADIAPDGASKPYTYTIDYGDGMSVTLTSSADPLALSHTFTAVGTYTVQISVWNCDMTVPVTDQVEVVVSEQAGPPEYKLYLPLINKNS
jgi:hypothetical protein